MQFDEIINRLDTHSSKWDNLLDLYGLEKSHSIPMWVADMDFKSPDCIREALAKIEDHGVFGYYGDERSYLESICWWMKTRHKWDIQSDWIFTTNGLVSGFALCVNCFTNPLDSVILITPVYHRLSQILKENNRQILELPLKKVNNRYQMDFDRWEYLLTGEERMLVICSPLNPGGRVWTIDELKQVGDFVKRHDLLLVCDEVHHDLVYQGATHYPIANVCPSILQRLILMTAASKTFNIAGAHIGNIIIPNKKMRIRFKRIVQRFGISPNLFGMTLVEAAYTQSGASWVNELISYLEINKNYFNSTIGSISGAEPMELESTYLAWVDFSEMDIPMNKVIERLEKKARIATSYGSQFGTGGENFLRFNFAMPKRCLEKACERLEEALRNN